MFCFVIVSVVEPNEAEMFTNHGIVSFEFSSAAKVPSKLRHYVYDYG